jgi:quercetin 2,3-dioxygenase
MNSGTAYPTREVQLGSLDITRALPVKERRLVGPWCFLDRFGPRTFTDERPMDVAPHPHIGIQTVSWLLEGEVLHDDSLGYQALLRAGGVNTMTSGHGISHSEQTPKKNTGRLNGVQLWVALPESHRHAAPSLQHIEKVPVSDLKGGIAQVFAGSFANVISPARHFSEIVGADIRVHRNETICLALDKSYEHSILVLDGDCELNGEPVGQRVLYFLESGRSEIQCRSRGSGRLLLLGGSPFPETIVMWWNFVARTREEVAEARADWEQHHERFGEVKAYVGARLDAPALRSA